MTDRAGLRSRILAHARQPLNDVKRLFGGMAPLVTAAADASPLADAACVHLASAGAIGVRLLSAHLSADPVPVVLIGGLATSPAFASRLTHALRDQARDRCRVVDPVLSPPGGAALMALQRIGLLTNDAVGRLAASP